jgi:hypothetical protein
MSADERAAATNEAQQRVHRTRAERQVSRGACEHHGAGLGQAGRRELARTAQHDHVESPVAPPEPPEEIDRLGDRVVHEAARLAHHQHRSLLGRRGVRRANQRR